MKRRTGHSDRTPARPRAAAALAIVALLAAGGCGRHEAAPAEGAAVAVRTATLAAATEPGIVEATGTLRAAREATLAAKVMGNVIEVRKSAGEAVKAGEILLVVDSRDVAGQIAQARGALAQAQAAATLAETNFHRFEQLHERGAASRLELDQARYQYETAAGAVKQAEGAVATASSYESYARIAAPFDGRVAERLCEPGDLATPGQPLMRVEGGSHLRLFASLDAARAGAARVGTRVEVDVPDAGFRRGGTIREAAPAADPATRTIIVKIDLDDDPVLNAGLFGRALIPLGERPVLRVPAAAVVRRGSLAGVFVQVDGRAAFRMVALDDRNADMPEVLSGLAAGDVVVLDPPGTLEIGARLEARS